MRRLAWCALRRAAAVASCGALLALSSAIANAQDFSPAEPAGPASSAAGLLERGLPGDARAELEASTTSWLGVPGLVTRTLCGGMRVRTVTLAAGWALTGEPPVGWLAAGLAAGAVSEWGGVALRAVARRDNDPLASREAAQGAELGGGAWLSAGPGVRVWARAPQLATFGAAPPLARALAVGVSAERDGLAAWFEREAPARRGEESGTHTAGVALSLAPGSVWVEGRGHPLRAGFGISLGVIAVRAMGHPRLGDTVTLSLRLPPHRERG